MHELFLEHCVTAELDVESLEIVCNSMIKLGIWVQVRTFNYRLRFTGSVQVIVVFQARCCRFDPSHHALAAMSERNPSSD